MIPRYTRQEMGKLWDQQNRFQKWLDVEIAVCEAWAEMGEIPEEALKIIKEKAGFNIARIDEIEKTVKHEVIAFLASVCELVGPEARYIHKGLTSYDIVDTALSLLLRESADIIIEDLKKLLVILKDKAFQYKNTPCIGRSHGVHAEPMTFGLKFALWHEDIRRALERMQRAKEVVSVGKISGTVGTFSNTPPELEERVCKKLKLIPELVATQVIQRDRHAEYMTTLALIAANVEKISVEIRHLQRTEVLEVEEPFTTGQKGSSAMPHKRNPVGTENLSGLARVVRANAIAALENIVLWHERDISHSSVERIIIPDSIIVVDYMLNRLADLLKDLVVYPEKMLSNIQKSYGLYNSQRVMLALIDKGLSRESAYELTQKKAMESWNTGTSFIDLLLGDKKIREYLSEEDIREIFDFKYYLRNIDYIYNRVFGGDQ